MTSSAPPVPSSRSNLRVRIFVDFWNFQLAVIRTKGNGFRIDWKALGPRLMHEAHSVGLGTHGSSGVQYDGMHVYLSYNASTSAGRGLKNWALNTLDRFPGIQVTAKARKRRRAPKCPACRQEIGTCPKCGATTEGTVEKGVDTAIVTDMIKLAWADAYDVAIIVSADADFVPAVQFLDSKGVRVIQGGFPPLGVDLARTCWASINVATLLDDVQR